MYKFFVSDIDHTLFDPNSGIHPENIKSLIKLQEMGVTLVLASGRSIEAMRVVVDELHLNKSGGYLIATNGTVLQKIGEAEPFAMYNHAVSDIHSYIQTALDLGLHYSIEQNKILYYSHKDRSVIYEEELCKMKIQQVEDLKKDIVFDFPKLALHTRQEDSDHLFEAFREAYKNQVCCEFSSNAYMDVMPFGHSKLTGLLEILKREKVTLEEVAAIGDGVNDYELIKNAGLSAAVNNANDDLKEVAHLIVGHAKDAGVAEFIEHILSKNAL